MSTTCVITSTTDPLLLRRLYRRWFWRSTYGLIFAILLTIALVGSAAIGFGTGNWIAALVVLLVLGAMAYSAFGPMFVRIAGLVDKAGKSAEPITFSFSDDGIDVARAGKTASFKWDSVRRAVEHPEGFIFYTKSRPFIVLKSGSTNESHLTELRNLCRDHLISRAQVSLR